MKLRTLTKLAAASLVLAAPASLYAADAEEGKPAKTMPETPPDVAAAPADALKTESGLQHKLLTEGTGKTKPTATDTVTVHYSGWTTDGKLFDSSVERGEPASFPLNGVIAGWTEGLQLMVEGEKRRFWIPADLAYGEDPAGGRPGGLLVFDVELISIKQAPKPAELPKDLEKSKLGVAYKITKKGEGTDKPGLDDVVTFHMTAKSMEGQPLQDTRSGPTPPSVPLSGPGLPPELAEALGDMVVGEQRTCWLPEARIPGGFVVADLELISFKKAPPAPAVPEDVGAVPADAVKTESGLASKIIKAAEGEKPKATDTVSVHYTGWTLDGKMFDSSVTRGEPTQFPLNQVIKGWTEGVQLMNVGEKRRFWIPADLAYGENPQGGAPGGMLVFDIELLEIVR